MDETCIYLDCPSNYTYSAKEVRRVKASTAGGERTRLSACFTAAANGQKLPIFSIIPRVNSIPQLDSIDNMEFDYKTQSTFNDLMILKYLERIIIPYMQSKSYERVLLIIGRATCHTTAKVMTFCHDHNIDLQYIPGRMTNLLQPADVAWFATIKKAYREKWNHWFTFDIKEFTRNNNMKSPGFVLFLLFKMK